MTCQGSFADESARAKQPHGPPFLFRHDDEFDMTLLDIENCVALSALAKNISLGL